MPKKILDSITVVDTSSYVTGGFATLMLANHGAEIIKIERPGSGDQNRESGPPFVEGESAYFLTVNYSKKSIELNLKTEEGQEILYNLVKDADVFVENFRPSVTDRLSIDEATLREYNRDLIYCSISGFGETGPWSALPGFDPIIQARSGLMSVTGEEDGEPVKVGVAVTDLVTGMWASFGIVNALYKREMTGDGEYIDLAMFDSVLPLLTKQTGKALENEEPKRTGTRDPVVAPYQAFKTKDGYIVIGAGTEKLWKEFCNAIDRMDLYHDDRFETNGKRVENVDELEREIEPILKKKTVGEWEEILIEEYEFPAAKINTISEALYNEQSEARNMIRSLTHSKIGDYPVIEHPIKYENSETGFEFHSPVLGEHTEDVLESLGWSTEEISKLEEKGVIGDI